MSIDRLQKQIRKLKNPSMISFCFDHNQIPPRYCADGESVAQAYGCYAKDLLTALKDIVPAVRFSFGSFCLFGAEGVSLLSELLNFSKKQGFYVLLDAPEMWSVRQTELAADALMGSESQWVYDGLLLACYMGSDAIKPFTEHMKNNDKDLFVVLRTANKSSQELQDLLTGSRQVYTAAADIVKRIGERFVTKNSYSRVAAVGPATSADCLSALRTKYPSVFLLIDGFDYSGANAKNCSLAFDKLGHGAVVCATSSITAAWQNENIPNADEIALAVSTAERMKKNLNRYLTIL